MASYHEEFLANGELRDQLGNLTQWNQNPHAFLKGSCMFKVALFLMTIQNPSQRTEYIYNEQKPTGKYEGQASETS
jgi:hypothetical protein